MQKNNIERWSSSRMPSYVNKQLCLLNKVFICSLHTHINVLFQQTINTCWANKRGLWIWTSVPNTFFLLGQLTLFNSVTINCCTGSCLRRQLDVHSVIKISFPLTHQILKFFCQQEYIKLTGSMRAKKWNWTYQLIYYMISILRCNSDRQVLAIAVDFVFTTNYQWF